MRSKLFLALIACLPLGAAFAATPGEAFQSNREAILSGACVEADGYVFSVGRAPITTTLAIRDTVAKENAKLMASTDYLRKSVFAGWEWPDALSDETRRVLAKALLGRLGLSATLSGLMQVEVKKEGEEAWVVVLALPKAEWDKLPRLDFDAVRDTLLSERSVSAPGAPLEALLALRATLGPVPESVDRKPWEALLAEAKFPSDSLKALPRLAGRYPLGTTERPTDDFYTKGNAAFAKKDVRGAYVAYLNSLTRGWSFAALNMAGNCARRLDRNAEAAALLLQAAYLNPESPYPWIHLAFVARAVGDEALCVQCADCAEERAGENAWTHKQLAVLREPPEPVEALEELPSQDSEPVSPLPDVDEPVHQETVSQESPSEERATPIKKDVEAVPPEKTHQEASPESHETLDKKDESGPQEKTAQGASPKGDEALSKKEDEPEQGEKSSTDVASSEIQEPSAVQTEQTDKSEDVATDSPEKVAEKTALEASVSKETEKPEQSPKKVRSGTYDLISNAGARFDSWGSTRKGESEKSSADSNPREQSQDAENEKAKEPKKSTPRQSLFIPLQF